MPRPTPPVRDLIALIRRYDLTYATFNEYCKLARQYTNLRPSRTGRKLPKLLPDTLLQSFMVTVVNGENLKHEVLFKILFYTGVRVSELCNIQVADIDFGASKIYISQGKGAKDRYVLFLDQFKSLLRAYLSTVPSNTYLFESSHKRPYSKRRIHQLTKEYAQKAGITENVHPHLFRHQALTLLKKSGLDDAQIQLISGHASRKSLEIYTHLGLGDVNADYQEAMRKANLP